VATGTVMWFTGLPSSGKTTLARRVQGELEAAGRRAVLLDSDEVRAALYPSLGYSPGARDRFYRALAELAALLAHQGHVVLVAATAGRQAYRARAKALAPRFVEVFVDTPPRVCARRDAKGLYASGAKLPGRGAPYEPPRAPRVRAEGGASSGAVAACLRALGMRAAVNAGDAGRTRK